MTTRTGIKTKLLSALHDLIEGQGASTCPVVGVVLVTFERVPDGHLLIDVARSSDPEYEEYITMFGKYMKQTIRSVASGEGVDPGPMPAPRKSRRDN